MEEGLSHLPDETNTIYFIITFYLPNRWDIWRNTMTLKEFISKYNGKFVEYHSFSSGATNQCVDLANQWITEGLGFSAIIGTNAQDFPKKAGSNFTYILNTPTGQPEAGDLIIFKSADGVGHISIHVKNISLSLFTSFDQNYPTGSPCKEVNHNYTNVLGWLRAKVVTTENIDQLKSELADKIKTLADVTRQRDELDSANKSKDKLIEEITAQLTEAKTSSDGFRKQFNEFIAQLANKLGTRQETVEILASIDTCLEFEDKADKLDRTLELERKEHAVAIDTLEAKIKALELNLATLKADFKALKDTQITPINPINKFSIIELIKKLLGV